MNLDLRGSKRIVVLVSSPTNSHDVMWGIKALFRPNIPVLSFDRRSRVESITKTPTFVVMDECMAERNKGGKTFRERLEEAGIRFHIVQGRRGK